MVSNSESVYDLKVVRIPLSKPTCQRNQYWLKQKNGVPFINEEDFCLLCIYFPYFYSNTILSFHIQSFEWLELKASQHYLMLFVATFSFIDKTCWSKISDYLEWKISHSSVNMTKLSVVHKILLPSHPNTINELSCMSYIYSVYERAWHYYFSLFSLRFIC